MAKKQNNNQQSYLTTGINYVCEHPYQTAAMVVGTALVAYSLPVMITYGTVYYTASTKVATALASFGKGGLAVAQSKLVDLTTLNKEFTTQIMAISELQEITESLTFTQLTEAAQGYINKHLTEGVATTVEDAPVLVSVIIDSSQTIWVSAIESLTSNIDAYAVATTALAAVSLPTVAAVAGASGVVILTVAGLDMAGVIDVAGWMPHCS